MKRLYEAVGKVETQITKYLLFILAALVFAAAVARTIRHPINWALDAAAFLFAWIVFLGADIAMRKDRLFCITILSDKLSKKARMVLQIVNYAIIAAFLVGLIVYGVSLSGKTRLRTFQGIPGFSYTWVTLSVPFGCLLMLVTVVRKIGGFARAFRTGVLPQKEAGGTEII